MPKYWIGVASREHVMRGVSGGFAQVCHGKCGPLKKMNGGDWIIYYSPKLEFGKDAPCKKFTAIGQVQEGQPYEFQMAPDFIPWRRDVIFVPCKEVAIEPLLAKLSFIQNKQRWGFPFRRGCFEISKNDFLLIAQNMGVGSE